MIEENAKQELIRIQQDAFKIAATIEYPEIINTITTGVCWRGGDIRPSKISYKTTYNATLFSVVGVLSIQQISRVGGIDAKGVCIELTDLRSMDKLIVSLTRGDIVANLQLGKVLCVLFRTHIDLIKLNIGSGSMMTEFDKAFLKKPLPQLL